MDKISIAISSTYGNQGKYLPLLNQLGDELCYAYGIGFPRNYQYTDEPLKKMRLTKIPSRISGFIVNPFGKILHYPQYYTYWSNVKLCDAFFAGKAAKDDSRVIFTNPLLTDTVRKSKEAGKLVVVEAGNSEPAREHERIIKEYELFGIKNKYVYGNPGFRDACMKSYDLADYIITISHVSARTYEDAGYDMDKFKFIPLTGTDMPVQDIHANTGKKKAFISTAFHNFIKGTHRLLLAWQKAGIKDIPLIIAGRLCEDMQEFIDKYGPFENVIYAGHQSALQEWYKQFDAVGVLMSLSEGAGRTTPEMMSFGFPMIVSPDATCDIVLDGWNGYIVDPYNENALVEKLLWFADQWERVYQMRRDTLAAVSQRSVYDFSVELGEFLLSLL